MKKNAIKIRWINRYSETIEDDEFGRWAIVGYAGIANKIFLDDKPCNYEIVWIKKVMDKFFLHYQFPCSSNILFDTIEECKINAEQ